MKHESRFLGSVEYESEDVISLPMGVAGYESCHRFVVVDDERTHPARWLISLDEHGPELPLLDPAVIGPYSIRTQDVSIRALQSMGLQSIADMDILCPITVTDEIRKASMDLRAPILIHWDRRLGYQHVWPQGACMPVRKHVYGDLARPDDPQERNGMVIIHRKVGETIEIGEDITMQVMELADGGVRLGVGAPRRVNVRRGRRPVTVAHENMRANEETCLESLEFLMEELRFRYGTKMPTGDPVSLADVCSQTPALTYKQSPVECG